MKIKHLHIQNYKSLVDLKIVEPNAFTVFAGPNGAGKSNIFEALEFVSYSKKMTSPFLEDSFGGYDKIVNCNSENHNFYFQVKFDFVTHEVYKTQFSNKIENSYESISKPLKIKNEAIEEIAFHTLEDDANEFYNNCLHLFINKLELNRIRDTSNKKLLPDASNLSAVVKNILSNNYIKEEFLEWINLFIPGFENIEVHSDIDGASKFLIFEKGSKKPFDKNLISDGTYNILVLLAAVYQNHEPQFLCIEEPENGLNPYVIKTLVDFFRKQCEEKGHYIWLNTHSQTLVKELQPHELILVDKVNGATQVKQFPKDYNLQGLTMDEAWLSNALGGGLPW